MRSRRRWIAAIVAGCTLLPALMVLDIHRRAGVTLERHRGEVESGRAALRARSSERPVVLGEPEEGNAWDLYRQAFAGLQKMTPAEKEAIPEIDGTWDADRKPNDPAIAALYRKYEPELGLLRQGTRRRLVDPGVQPEIEFEFPELTQSIAVARILRGAAGLSHRRGNPREAVEFALTGLALGQDCGRRSYLIGALVQLVHEDIALDAFREVLEAHLLDPDALAETASRLDRLMAGRPSWYEAMDWEDVYLRKNILDYPSWEKAFPLSNDPPRPGWRQCFSDRVMRAQALNLHSEWLALVRRTRGRSHRDRGRLRDEAAEFSKGFTNPLAKALFPAIVKVPSREDRALLGYRLCRLAVALAWFEAEQGRPPTSLAELAPRHIDAVPECPLTGTPFRYAPGKVWSVGKDGKDGGGAVDPTVGYEPDSEVGDVVWFVKRK